MHSSIISVPVKRVVELLKLEATAINQAAERLQIEQLEKVLNLLINCQGKVVLTGVGKSGIVAQKIAATLCSIGNVAVYLHPCDALHGDLGIITASDVVILFSNSGETQELIEIVPHLKHRQVPIIGILGNLDSTLARRVNVVLDASVDREACPLNLAPTTSTTVALAIGDAVAMTLMQMRSITPQDFALNHPAGRLGKRLTLRVVDLMHQGEDNPVIIPQASWIEIVSAITKGGLGAVNVINEKGELLGIITDGDLRRSIAKIDPKDLKNLQAAAIMAENPVTVQPEQLAYDALQLMENRSSQISVLPVVDEVNYCVGLLRLHDIARSGIL
ncbi:MAG: KpsF/GutQ family sugar-phosphate isomerase [Rivularia sp. (in: cyanobacteria)]